MEPAIVVLGDGRAYLTYNLHQRNTLKATVGMRIGLTGWRLQISVDEQQGVPTYR